MDYAALSPVDLAIRCLRGGQEEAWAEFIRRFNPLISAVALRVAQKWNVTSRHIVDDVVQEIYLKLCTDREHILANFNPSHPDSIFGFIKVVATNTARDHFKSLHARKRGVALTADVSQYDRQLVPPDSRHSLSSQETSILHAQIDSFLRSTETGPNSERDRNIFWLYYRVGLTAAAIAGTAGIDLNTKGVESTILRLTRRVRAHMVLAPIRLERRAGAVGTEGIRAADSL